MPRLAACLVALSAALSTTACAPDAFSNMRAPKFNDFLDTVQDRCAPLAFGSLQMTVIAAPPGLEDNYGFWFNLTSRLFFRRMTADQYREAMRVWFPGPGTQRSTECLLAQLPPEDKRPTHPPGWTSSPLL